jgi:exopolyphosphatase/guanosine-5'-triphosphate,3'-diphosphate pyrophosphatase
MSNGDANSNNLTAAIDIGSNSIHMAIGRYVDGIGLEIIDTEKISVQLGRALDANGHLNSDAIRKAAEAVGDLKERSDLFGAECRIVATHASRTALNRDELVQAIKSGTGLDVEIIDGISEAKFTFLGVQQSILLEGSKVLAIDVGGGSTEIMVAQGDQMLFVTSLPIGAVTMTKMFLSKDKPTDGDINRMKDYVWEQVSPAAKLAKQAGFDQAVLSSGTAKALAAIDIFLHHGDQLDDFNGHSFSGEAAQSIFQKITQLREPRKIRARLNLSQNRSESLVAGSCIIAALSKALSVQDWHFSLGGLREGVIVDTFQKKTRSSVPPLNAVRRNAIRSFSARFAIPQSHAETTFVLAKSAYEQLQPQLLNKQSDEAKIRQLAILELAAYFSDAGRLLNYQSVHKISGFMVAHAAIPGFTQAEKHLAGQILLAQKKANASSTVLGWKLLFNKNHSVINILAACLKIGLSLSKTHPNRLERVKFDIKSSGLLIRYPNGSRTGKQVRRLLEPEAKQIGKLLGKAVDFVEE